MQRLRHIMLLLALLYAVGAQAQGCDASATLSADPQRILVGDQSRVFLSAQHDPLKSRITWPAVPDSFGKLEVIEKGKIDTIKNGSFTLYRQRLLVTGFDSGEHRIPPFQMTVTPVSGAPYTVETGIVDMLVQTVAVDTTKPIKPIKGIMIVESSWLDYIWWIAGAVLLLAALGLIYYFMRQKKHAILPPPPPKEPLHVQAMRLLTALESEGLWQKGEVKEHYVRLTDILRGYIEARYGVPAMERTTDELTTAAAAHGELVIHTDRLYRILSTADAVKFARAQPLPAEHLTAMQATKDFITATIPVITPPTPSEQP